MLSKIINIRFLVVLLVSFIISSYVEKHINLDNKFISY